MLKNYRNIKVDCLALLGNLDKCEKYGISRRVSLTKSAPFSQNKLQGSIQHMQCISMGFQKECI